MNINITLPEHFLEKLMLNVERITVAIERIAGPAVPVAEPKPFDRSLWGYTSNAESRQVEEDERREREGFGPDYEHALEAAAISTLSRADDNPKG